MPIYRRSSKMAQSPWPSRFDAFDQVTGLSRP